MATLTRFKDAFKPATAFYTGTGATQLVPDVFPVAINGRPYMIDTGRTRSRDSTTHVSAIRWTSQPSLVSRR